MEAGLVQRKIFVQIRALDGVRKLCDASLLLCDELPIMSANLIGKFREKLSTLIPESISFLLPLP